jgi:hypothetical protein
MAEKTLPLDALDRMRADVGVARTDARRSRAAAKLSVPTLEKALARRTRSGGDVEVAYDLATTELALAQTLALATPGEKGVSDRVTQLARSAEVRLRALHRDFEAERIRSWLLRRRNG